MEESGIVPAKAHDLKRAAIHLLESHDEDAPVLLELHVYCVVVLESLVKLEEFVTINPYSSSL